MINSSYSCPGACYFYVHRLILNVIPCSGTKTGQCLKTIAIYRMRETQLRPTFAYDAPDIYSCFIIYLLRHVSFPLGKSVPLFITAFNIQCLCGQLSLPKDHRSQQVRIKEGPPTLSSKIQG
jgi:hypothetical protein